MSVDLNIQTIPCLLRCERHDGNDPIEAEIRLPVVPRKGDKICIWNPQAPFGGGEEYIEVTDVVMYPWAPERIDVWVRVDTYDVAEVERILLAAHRNEQP